MCSPIYFAKTILYDGGISLAIKWGLNMLENLNAISFKAFGEIVHEGFYHGLSLLNQPVYSIRELEITSQYLDSLNSSPQSPVIMEIVDGLGVLCISDSEQLANIHLFLLDKAVYINRGVFYGIFALNGECTIRLAVSRNAEMLSIPSYSNLGAPFLSPEVKINRIRTLFYQEKEQGFIFKGERHDFWELTYVDKGILYCTADEKGYKLSQGDLLFHAPGQFHAQWSDERASTSFVTITFDMEYNEQDLLIADRFSIDNKVQELIQKIIKEYERGTYYSNDLILCYLKEFILLVLRDKKLEDTLHRLDSPLKAKIEGSIVEKSIQYIKDNIGRRLSVGDIARNAAISQSYLSHIFKKQTGVRLNDYISICRLEKSKEFIRSTRYNFTEIADMLGYASVHYFSRQFKTNFGITPTEYSRAIRK